MGVPLMAVVAVIIIMGGVMAVIIAVGMAAAVVMAPGKGSGENPKKSSPRKKRGLLLGFLGKKEYKWG